jgi:hypothetical protein
MLFLFFFFTDFSKFYFTIFMHAYSFFDHIHPITIFPSPLSSRSPQNSPPLHLVVLLLLLLFQVWIPPVSETIQFGLALLFTTIHFLVDEVISFFFKWLCNTLLCTYTTCSFSIHRLMSG